jgi:hypothetical protein
VFNYLILGLLPTGYSSLRTGAQYETQSHAFSAKDDEEALEEAKRFHTDWENKTLYKLVGVI